MAGANRRSESFAASHRSNRKFARLSQRPRRLRLGADYSSATNAGQKFALSFLLVMTVRDGHIVELRDDMDALGAANALHRLPQMIEALAARGVAP